MTQKRWAQRECPGWQDVRRSLAGQGIQARLAELLARRGHSHDEALVFLRGSIKETFPDEAALKDMPRLLERLEAGILFNETIGIVGDYDVDGITSTTIMTDLLRSLGCSPVVVIPHRETDGYGLTDGIVDRLAGQGVNLIITVDCGSTSTLPIARANHLGMDVVVLDHHNMPAENIPNALAIVNPRRLDDRSGIGHPCAATIVFLASVFLLERMRRAGDPTRSGLTTREFFKRNIDLVALASVADVVPLVGLTRALTIRGLIEINGFEKRVGIDTLMAVAGGRWPATARTLGFTIGPRINAPGRLAHAAPGLDLLLASTRAEATVIAERMHATNAERQHIETADLEQAMARAGDSSSGTNVIVVAERGWNPGVMGLVAARLRERFGVPAFALTEDGQIVKGSGRSIPGVDLGAAVLKALDRNIVLKGGGHAMAAGVTIAGGGVNNFRAFMNDELGPTVRNVLAVCATEFDLDVPLEEIGQDLFDALEMANPYGAGNPEPIIRLRADLTAVSKIKEAHVAYSFSAGSRAIRGIKWRAADTPLFADHLIGRKVEALGVITKNEFNGRTSYEIQVEDLRPAR